ncbi:MAG: sulfotransferase, partial [Planctomycetota bacterium]
NKSFIVLAAIEWMILMDSFDAATANLGSDVYKLIKYEDLCTDVSGVMKDVTDFCELEWTDGFANRMSQYTLRSANDKYKTELNAKQQQDLQEVLEDYLKKHGYE